MTAKLNRKAFDHAKSLIRAGKIVKDEDGWGDHAPSADDENRFIEKNGWSDYAQWHLSEDKQESEETKGRYGFPFGDFTKVHRDGVIAVESRAAQNDHDDIAKAAKELLDLIDGE